MIFDGAGTIAGIELWQAEPDQYHARACLGTMASEQQIRISDIFTTLAEQRTRRADVVDLAAGTSSLRADISTAMSQHIRRQTDLAALISDSPLYHIRLDAGVSISQQRQSVVDSSVTTTQTVRHRMGVAWSMAQAIITRADANTQIAQVASYLQRMDAAVNIIESRLGRAENAMSIAATYRALSDLAAFVSLFDDALAQGIAEAMTASPNQKIQIISDAILGMIQRLRGFHDADH